MDGPTAAFEQMSREKAACGCGGRTEHLADGAEGFWTLGWILPRAEIDGLCQRRIDLRGELPDVWNRLIVAGGDWLATCQKMPPKGAAREEIICARMVRRERSLKAAMCQLDTT